MCVLDPTLVCKKGAETQHAITICMEVFQCHIVFYRSTVHIDMFAMVLVGVTVHYQLFSLHSLASVGIFSRYNCHNILHL